LARRPRRINEFLRGGGSILTLHLTFARLSVVASHPASLPLALFPNFRQFDLGMKCAFILVKGLVMIASISTHSMGDSDVICATACSRIK
jgi:hypothetical protein